MDAQVIAAMARWPNVPAVYGWLSLTESGQWRLHPQGDAIRQPTAVGEDITSPQILAFIGRNYESDEQGQWYFQNGPQRVYVRLDAAPLILHTTIDSASGRLKLRTHTGLDIQALTALYVDETGRLYAATDRGPALIAGRDLPSVLDAMEADTDVADAITACMERGQRTMLSSRQILGFPAEPVSLSACAESRLEATLGFRRYPVEPASGAPASPPSGSTA